MGVLDWARKLLPPPYEPETKAYPGSGVTFAGQHTGNWTYIGDGIAPDAEQLTRHLALATSAYCYTAVMYRAEKVAEPPMIVQDVDGAEIAHPLGMILTEPSPDYDMGFLLTLTETYQLTTGAALWVVERSNGGQVQRLTPYSADEFTVYRTPDRMWGRFEVNVHGGSQTYFAEDGDVVYFREPNPNSWYEPLSRVEVALSQLDLGHQVNRTVRRFMRNAMFPGGVMAADPSWNPDDEAWSEFKNNIKAWHTGPRNAGEPLVTMGGVKYSPTVLALKDMLPGEMLDRIEATVGSVFKIAPIVLGWHVGLQNSPWSQMATARLMTYEDCILPRLEFYRRTAGRQLLPMDERARGVELAFDLTGIRALAADDLNRAAYVEKVRPELRLNERRVYLGEDPLDDGDDRGDEIGVAPAPTGPTFTLSQPTGWLQQKGAADLAVFDFATKASERGWEDAYVAGLRKMQADVLALYDANVRPETKAEGDPPDPGSIAGFISALVAYLKGEGLELLRSIGTPLVRSTGETAVRTVAENVGITFARLQEGLADFVETRSAFLAEVMAETTARRITEEMTRQVEQGGLIRDVRKALEESHQFSRTRAQLVARTETTATWNGAQRSSLSRWAEDNPGQTVVKTWLSARDERVRDEHIALDGDTIPIDEAFANGLTEPGEPNCRCTLTYDIRTS